MLFLYVMFEVCSLLLLLHPPFVADSIWIWISMLLLKAKADRERFPGHRQEQRAQSPLRSEQGALATKASGTDTNVNVVNAECCRCWLIYRGQVQTTYSLIFIISYYVFKFVPQGSETRHVESWPTWIRVTEGWKAGKIWAGESLWRFDAPWLKDLPMISYSLVKHVKQCLSFPHKNT